MSTEQVDPQLIEETKQQIRSLVADISRLAKSDSTPEEFFSSFLSRIIEALAAVGGAVYLRSHEGALELKHQQNLREARLHESQEAQNQHGKLLYQVLNNGEGTLIAPHSGSGVDGDGASNPTDYLLVLGPLRVDQQVEGVVEILQRHGAKSNTQRGYLRFLLQMCELAGEFLKTRQLRHYTDRQALWNQLDNFTRIAHASLDPRETAYTIANEGRRLIDCDRVSVAIRKGSKCHIESVSGQDTFDKRSNTVSLLSRLATAVVRSGDTMWYTGDTSNMAPQVEEAVQEYVDDSHSKTVAVVPLRRPRPESASTDIDADLDNEPIGALIIEQIEDARPKEGMLQRVDVVSSHCSTALANALEHQNLFLMPLWRTLGKATWIIHARTLPKTIAVAVVLVAAILALWLVPADLELKGDGTLEPVIQREVFAHNSGDIMQVLVDHAEMVRPGTQLVKMRSTDLDLKIENLEGQKNASQKRIIQLKDQAMRASRDSRGASDQADKLQLTGELRVEEEKLASVIKQLELMHQEKEHLTVVSPMAGQVLTPWDALENLMRRPVERGTALMTIADPSGDWEVRVNMPEDRMGHIAQAQKDLKELNGELPVTFVLATDPGTEHRGTIREINTRAEVKGQDDEGNTVLIRVKINKEELKYLRPRAEVKVKVYAGRCSLGYSYLHDLIAWLQRFKFDWL